MIICLSHELFTMALRYLEAFSWEDCELCKQRVGFPSLYLQKAVPLTLWASPGAVGGRGAPELLEEHCCVCVLETREELFCEREEVAQCIGQESVSKWSNTELPLAWGSLGTFFLLLLQGVGPLMSLYSVHFLSFIYHVFLFSVVLKVWAISELKVCPLTRMLMGCKLCIWASPCAEVTTTNNNPPSLLVLTEQRFYLFSSPKPYKFGVRAGQR